MKKENLDRSITNLSPYDQPHVWKSVWQLVNTLGLNAIFWYISYLALSVSFWLSLPFSIITAAITVRVFIIFHDCCHRSFFKSKLANQIVGFISGVLTFTPYDQWRYTHAVHHATSGNLNKRGTGDIWTLTLNEYFRASRLKKFLYRLYRNPLFMFIIGPIYIFLVDYRFNRPKAPWKEKVNLYLTNLAIAGAIYGMSMLVGWQAFLMVHVPVFFFSGMLGIWLFYVQHQFEDTYYSNDEQWSFVDAALKGSSFFRLPGILNWFTGSIGFHHVHHLNARVPNYNLQTVHDTKSEFQKVPVITLRSSFASMKLVLWDEENQRLIGWKDMRRIRKNQRQLKKVS